MQHAWRRKDAFVILVGKPEGRRPIQRPTCRWVCTGRGNGLGRLTSQPF
jgi:hypothetical protein